MKDDYQKYDDYLTEAFLLMINSFLKSGEGESFTQTALD